MINIKPGDIVAIKANRKYYYAIILTKIIMFGGNLVYAFHLETDSLLTTDELLHQDTSGFNSIVDFVFAKRENRLTKIGEIINIYIYWKHKYFKSTNTLKGKADKWYICDNKFKDIKQTRWLSDQEKKYPLQSRIDDYGMIKLIRQKWTPEKDSRINEFKYNKMLLYFYKFKELISSGFRY